MNYDMPDNRPTKTPDGRRNRNLILVVLACLAAVAVIAVGVSALTAGSDGRPQSTGSAESTETTETTQKYVFMTEGGGALAKLEMVVKPSGEVTGTHVMVRFSDNTGDPRFGDPEPFGGTFTGASFELTGLSDNGLSYQGTLQGDTLELDGTFGVSNEVWTLIPSAEAFDQAVQEHAASLEGCEQEGHLGCKED